MLKVYNYIIMNIHVFTIMKWIKSSTKNSFICQKKLYNNDKNLLYGYIIYS